MANVASMSKKIRLGWPGGFTTAYANNGGINENQSMRKYGTAAPGGMWHQRNRRNIYYQPENGVMA